MIREGILEATQKGKIEIKGANPSDRFYLVKGEDYILLKKVGIASSSNRFEGLANEIQNAFAKANIRKSDIAKAVRWAKRK